MREQDAYYSEREQIKLASDMFYHLKHDGVKGRSKHDYTCGWLDKCNYELRKATEQPPELTTYEKV